MIAAGLIVTKLRNRLSSEVVDQIIFLNKNKMKVKYTTTVQYLIENENLIFLNKHLLHN
jgi:hypothetical protein